MPFIQLTAPEGALTPEGRETIRTTLARLLLRWDGAPDTAFFRSVTWTQFDELPPGALTALEDDEPRFRVDVRVPAGALSQRRKEGLIGDVTAAVLKAAGLSEADALRIWVLVHEQPDGTWGAGGNVVRYADLVALAADGQDGGGAS
ncbi:4-oxalocrotonate tautomerase family protein [Streptomyces sp. NPDC048639]|uniref:tautomerase family protein n=1 Tax=Streptomyces sp. NPDC048639 TaxID=3365581 RepID=UPI003710053B